MAGETKRAVISAVIGNLLIAVVKFIAAAFSGSAAMLAEAIHSLVDTGNDGLMLYGIRRSSVPADVEHPFGHGHELYFWTLIVGVLFFGVGGGMSIVTGLAHLANPLPPQNVAWSYAVIASAFVFEGVSWYYGLSAFRKERRGRGFVETIRVTKDPTSFSVLLEDSAALIGLALAFAGIFLSERLNEPWIDGVSSVLIGVLLCLIALVMVYESKGLLVGEGEQKATLDDIRAIVHADPYVERVDNLLTLYLGPDEMLLAIQLRFHSHITMAELREAIARIRHAVQARYPSVRRVFIDATAIGE